MTDCGGLPSAQAGPGVDRLDARLAEFQFGGSEGPGEPGILPGQPLGLDQEAEAFVEAELARGGVLLLVAQE